MALNAASWPVALLPRSVDFMPEQQSRSGGASLAGSEQVTVSNSGRWRARVTVAVRGETTNLALRAFVAQMEGRAGTVLVPKWERFRPRDMNGREFSQVPGVGYACGDLNFDLSGFGQTHTDVAVLAAEASAGATRVSLNLHYVEGPRPGHYFGIGQRLYRVQQVWQETPEGPTQIQFWPRLRVSAPASVPVMLDLPVCLMRFAQDDAGEASLSRAGSGLVAFDFIEAAPSSTEVNIAPTEGGFSSGFNEGFN